ncbi:MAG: GldG family protein [Candidatus Muirbacterium halophilum]|nr:GldG family protein [Candidatus Muirbacterium halophilum]MCK9475105.1 GldG family protein [Candidatus Muirbacterium halophilum]
MNERFKKYTVFNIIAAILLIFVAVFTYFYQGTFGWITTILITLATIFIITWLVFNNDILKTTVKGRSVKYSTNAIVFAVIILSILLSTYYVIMENNKEIDLTPNKIYSLSPQTIQILQNLKKDIKIVGFFDLKSFEAQKSFEELIARYKIYTKNIDIEIIDPYENPVTVKQFGISKVPNLVFICEDNEKRVNKMNESEFTNAIKAITMPDRKKIYFVQGHGENRLDSSEENALSIIKNRLESDNYNVQPLELIRTGSVPEDASVLIVSGAKKKYMETELTALENYIDNNGKVIFMIDPDKENFTDFLKPYGFEIEKNVIIDVNPVAQLLGTNYVMPIISSYRNHDIVRKFDLAVVLNIAMEIKNIEENKKGFRVLVVAETGDGSWAEKNVDELFGRQKTEVSYDEGIDNKGPLPVAVIAEKTNNQDNDEEKNIKAKSQIVVFGDSDFITNSMVNMQGNGDLFLNCVNFLSGDTDLISIRPKETESQPIQINEAQGQALFFLYYLILPLLPMLLYAAMYINKRRKRA